MKRSVYVTSAWTSQVIQNKRSRKWHSWILTKTLWMYLQGSCAPLLQQVRCSVSLLIFNRSASSQSGSSWLNGYFNFIFAGICQCRSWLPKGPYFLLFNDVRNDRWLFWYCLPVSGKQVTHGQFIMFILVLYKKFTVPQDSSVDEQAPLQWGGIWSVQRVLLLDDANEPSHFQEQVDWVVTAKR